MTGASSSFNKTLNSTFIAGPASPSATTFTASLTSLTADGVSVATLTTTALDQFGNAVSGLLVQYSSDGTANSFAAASGTTVAGVYSTTLSSTTAQLKHVSALLGTGSGVFTLGPILITFVPGDPAAGAGASTLTKSTDDLTADGSSQDTITLVVRDAKGNVIPSLPNVSITVDGTANNFAPGTTTDANGQIQAALSSTKAQTKNITATIPRAVAGTPVQLTLAVTFVAGAAVLANSSLSLSASTLVADGATATTLVTTLHDVNQNPVPGDAVSYSFSGAANTQSPAGAITSLGDGTATATLASTKAQSEQITATVKLCRPAPRCSRCRRRPSSSYQEIPARLTRP